MAAPANLCIPYKRPGEDLTCTPTAAVTGKRFCRISGDRQLDGTFSIAPPVAAGRVFGVVVQDAAIGRKVGVISAPGEIVPVTTAAANIPAFTEVQVDATGAIIALAAGVAVGYLVTASGAAGTDAMVKLY